MTTRDPDQRIPTQRGTVSVGELQARCRVVEPGVVYFLEIPNGTVEAFEVSMETLRDLAKDFERFVVLVDLTEASRPRPDLIEYIIRCIQTVGIHWCAIKPGNRFMRSVIQFVVARMAGVRSRVTLHESMDDALAAARTALKNAQTA